MSGVHKTNTRREMWLVLAAIVGLPGMVAMLMVAGVMEVVYAR